MKILRVLGGIVFLCFIGLYIFLSNIHNDWINHIGAIYFAIPFLMYALKGNDWPQAN